MEVNITYRSPVFVTKVRDDLPVCMRRMNADAIFKKLEELAVRLEEGIATDDVNGCEHSVC